MSLLRFSICCWFHRAPI